ncbi:glycoside hydrolase family 88/105 protein [Catalinimonas alkaloidigena]|uniref:glycoside hydrolase family 88/105 protein n=1 Tax=Catalinimonas alkaloidigena TaxID=1075417 RepID=UPI002405F0E2|nr:glycoside hydrolase family 88 protein [Catalinimonas alkaloidigena]
MLTGCSDEKIEKSTKLQEVADIMKKVSDWQLNNPVERINDVSEMWERSVFYIGLMATYRTTKDERYKNIVLDWCISNEYKLGPRRTHGDDHVIGQIYLELYEEYQDPAMIEDIVSVFDDMMMYNWSGRQVWNWCDGLFMAPPVLSHLAKLTQQHQYITYMDSLWWDTYEALFDTDDQLFYRDNRYIDTLDVNGKKIFWSRGNGWVIAGIVRLLNHLPKTHPTYERYLDVYLKMANSIALRQGIDGLWKTNLLDPNRYPISETSGTAFFTYAFAWGVNQGYLHKNIYLPLIDKAWVGMLALINEEGRLGYVQQPWHEPGPVYVEGHQEYGTGAFLLAASEYYNLLAN